MGKAAARIIVENGGDVLLASRTAAKLVKAQTELQQSAPTKGGSVAIHVLDATDEVAVQEFAEKLDSGVYDGLVISSAGRAPHGPMQELETQATRDMMESKVWSAYHCSKHISKKLREGGSVVFVAGILNRRPGLNCCPLAMANGALEGLTRSLALEWGPRLRVNCLSPGFCDTERFDHMDAGKKTSMMRNTAASLPLRKVGQPRDMGEAIYYLLTAPFCTGVVLDVDGGHGIRQYANPTKDPMRKP